MSEPSESTKATASAAPIDESTAQGQLDQAVALVESGDGSAALKLLVELLRGLADTAEPAFAAIRARTLLQIAALLAGDRRDDLAQQALDRVINEHGGVLPSAVQARFAKAALVRKGGDKAAALAAYVRSCSEARPALASYPQLQEPLVHGLFCVAELQTESGHYAEAIAALDEIVARLGDQGDGCLEQVMLARYNRAVLLRDSGSPDAAAAYRGVADEGSTSSSDAVRRFAALATYNLGVLQLRRGDQAAALETFERMPCHFDTTSDPVVRLRLAKAMYFGAELLVGSGLQVALDAFAKVVQRFEGDDDENLRRIVSGARRRLRLMHGWARATFNGASAVPDLNPAVRLLMERGHGIGIGNVLNIIEEPVASGLEEPLTLAEVVEAVRAPRQEPPADADPELLEFAVRRNLLLAQLERDLQGHDRCGGVLRDYLERGEPFALYLRNFDLEGFVATGMEEGRRVKASLQFSGHEAVELRVAEILGRELPFIGVGNNAPLRPDALASIPRMMLTNDGWKDVVEEMIASAAIIVVHAARLTAGLSWEIDALQRMGAVDRSVIVLSTAPSEGTALAAFASTALGATSSPGLPVLADDPALVPFPHVIPDVELSDDVLARAWAAALLEPVHKLQALDPRARPRWDGVAF